MSGVATRWSVEQVLALAPDPSAERAARALAAARTWHAEGTNEAALVWGRYQGSAASPYETIVDVVEPAFRCSCPSRKVPCKHALGLLMRWVLGEVAPGDQPDWVLDWSAARARRVRRPPREPGEVNPATVARRAERIAGGLAELDRWLDDQLAAGVARLTTAGYEPFDSLAARLVDAQAPGAAGLVRRLAGVAVSGSPERLVTELGLLHLLVNGYRRLDQLPAGLAATVRARVGVPVSTVDVLATPPVHDRWAVVGVRDEADDWLTSRRVWLRGCDSGRPALVLSFAGPGQVLAAELVLGSTVDAELCFYPGAAPLRALIAHNHGLAGGTAAADPIATALQSFAEALTGDPWLDRWPMLLAAVVPTPTALVEADGTALLLDRYADEPWRLIAAAGGRPCRVMAEYGPTGVRPLTAWVDGRLIRP
jgi:SWIM zinc finger